MLRRIKYTKPDKDGICESINILSTDKGSNYKVYLDLNKIKYTIVNLLTYRKYEGGENVNNLHVLKRNVKKHLQKLGVKFGIEIRDRNYGVIRKGKNNAC